MFGAEYCVGCQGHNYHPEDKNRENRSKFIVTILGTKVTQDDLENVVRTQEENQQVESGWEKTGTTRAWKQRKRLSRPKHQTRKHISARAVQDEWRWEKDGKKLRDHSRDSARNGDYERKLNLAFVDMRQTGQRSGTSRCGWQCHLLRGNPRERDRFPGGERPSHCYHEISNLCFPPTLPAS